MKPEQDTEHSSNLAVADRGCSEVGILINIFDSILLTSGKEGDGRKEGCGRDLIRSRAKKVEPGKRRLKIIELEQKERRCGEFV